MRYYFVSYHMAQGSVVKIGSSLIVSDAERGVLNGLRKAVSESYEGANVVILNFKELSEEEYLRLKD